MDALDPRHGTTGGYRKGCREKCCRRAMADAIANRRRRLYLERRDSLTIDTYRVQRRIQALGALGWTLAELSRRAGYDRTALDKMLSRRPKRINEPTAQRIFDLYDELSMQLPPETTRYERHNAARARNLARRQGWAPPLAWDDIDSDPEPNYGHATDRVAGKFLAQPADDVDEVAVQRILDGDWRLSCTRADKVAVVARWTGSHNELERLTGWRVCRYVNREAAA